MPWQGDLAARRRLLFSVLLRLLCAALQPAESLEVKMEPSMTAFLNNDVLLPCNISEYNTPELDISKIGVTWYLETPGGAGKKPLYTVISRNHTSYRKGSELSEGKLKEGNAALFLPQIQLNEGGIYECFVTVTPFNAKGTTILEIVAQPAVNLSPRKLTVERNTEATVSCLVNKFYPDSIAVHWQKNSKHTADKSVSADQVCTGSSVKNEDGTFNITSKLSLQPSSEDNGIVYSCIIYHKSFSTEQVFNVTLMVTASANKLQIIAIVLGIFLGMLLAGLISLCVHYQRSMQYPPTMMAFLGNGQLKHLEDTQLLYLLSGFRPKPLGVNVFLTQPNGKKAKIFSWNSESVDSPENGDESIPLLRKTNSHVIMTARPDGAFDAFCELSIRPNVTEQDQFELSLEVSHEALQHGLLVKTMQFKVIALPLLDQVQCSADVARPKEPLSLSCRIHSYFPEEIEVYWYKDDRLLPEQPLISDRRKETNGLFSCISTITFNPQNEDVGKKFFCVANLKGIRQYKESSWELKVQDGFLDGTEHPHMYNGNTEILRSGICWAEEVDGTTAGTGSKPISEVPQLHLSVLHMGKKQAGPMFRHFKRYVPLIQK